MSNYIEAIRTAITVFPFIAIALSVIFIGSEYRRCKSFSLIKLAVINSFALYMLCAYCLIILPLPDKSYVASLTSPTTQLVPFAFILDFIKKSPLVLSDSSTYISALKSNTFLVPLFNVFLVLPFGMYMRYMFKTDMQKTLALSFALSLFFELTQLSGLYFIYSRSYRLFDVDDLILNTLGGVIGYLVSSPAVKALPSFDSLDDSFVVRDVNAFGLRRTASIVIDAVVFSAVSLVSSLFGTAIAPIFVAVVYFIAVPKITDGSTVGQKVMNLRMTGVSSAKQLVKRYFLFGLIYCTAPGILLAVYVTHGGMMCVTSAFAYIAYAVVKFMFSDSEMLYEKLSGTRLVYSENMKKAADKLPAAV